MKPRIVTVVGARPQFVKLGPVSRALRGKVREVLVHTGQHYDPNLDAVFFRELALPRPDYHLGAGSASHARQTAAVMERLERVLLKERPDAVLVYGDTNSTLGGALAAAKLGIPLIHVEAGLRSFNRSMPEEVNRVVADALGALLLCPTKTSLANLKKEGLARNARLVGDVMFDALLQNAARARRSPILEKLRLAPRSYYLATIHRAENTDDRRRLAALIAQLATLGKTAPVVFPVHPRTRKRLKRLPQGIVALPPVSYLSMLALEAGARAVLTDSGGVQKEAYWLGVPCVTLRAETEWVETLAGGWNRLAGRDAAKAALSARPRGRRKLPRAGAAARVADAVAAFLRRTR